jgi:hypothetical protein
MVDGQRPLPVFVSFQMEDSALRDALVKSLTERGIGFLDYSVQERLDEVWQEASSERIRRSAGTVVIIGRSTHESWPVAWEIAESVRLGKPVIAIRAPAGAATLLPEGLEEASVLPWNIPDLTDLIAKWRD